MVEHEKEQGFMSMIKDGLSYFSHIIAASIYTPMAEGTEIVMNNIEYRIRRMEKRILRKISSLFIIGFGGVFLIFALLFFLIESFALSKAEAYFSIGIVIFVIGLLLKLGESEREKNEKQKK